MIPPEHQAVAARAMRAALGDVPWAATQALRGADGVGGALAWRVEAAGRPYLLRLVKQAMPGVDAGRELAYMRRAAEAGVAPAVLHADVADGVLVSGWVDARPWPAAPAPPLAAALRALHAMPGFPDEAPVTGLDAFVRRLPAAGTLPADLAEELLAGWERATALPVPAADRVPCHNDLKPPNMLWDGARFRLVDWEAAFMNDRYNDLAIAASFAGGEALLAAYLGTAPTPRQAARFRLASLRVSAAYVAVCGAIAARAGAPYDPAAAAPDFAAFHAGLVAGTRDVSAPAAMRDYARVHLARALAYLRAPAFEADLAAAAP